MSSKSIVVYSNDLNQIALGSLKEQEQNLFFSIIVKLKDQGHAPVTFSGADLFNMLEKNYTKEQIAVFVANLREHFFKLDFRQVIKEGNKVIDDNINLFKYMRIEMDGSEVISLTIEVNERFEYILNELKANFTSFELANFLILHSKYSKTLFRLLKQYKKTGYARFEWPEFRKLMAVPAAYTTDLVDRKIINPSVRELTWDEGQIDLFTNYRGADKPMFKNLTYEKIKKNPGKKTSPVVAIVFRFDPEKVGQEIEKQPIAEGYRLDENNNLVPDYSKIQMK